MKEIDRVFTRCPFFGSRQIAVYLRREGAVVRRHRVRRLMARMGLEAIYKAGSLIEDIGKERQPNRHAKRALIWIIPGERQRRYSCRVKLQHIDAEVGLELFIRHSASGETKS